MEQETSESAEDGSCTVKLVPITQGEMKRDVSWSDFSTLLDRVESLEQNVSKGSSNGVSEEERKTPAEPSESDYEGVFELPETTYSLFISTNKVLSQSFALAIVAAFLSIFCLILVLLNELDNGDDDNSLNLPAGVNKEVRLAQYLGVIVGALMEEEIPLGLELFIRGWEMDLLDGEPHRFRSIVLTTALRLAVGYLFLSCLFMTVIQENDVISIFFDVLALEFVERLDDVIFGLAKRGFFGRHLQKATRHKHILSRSENYRHAYAKFINGVIRVVYILNVGLMVCGITVLTVQQNNGKFRCKYMTVEFDDDYWEEAYVRVGNRTEKRLLLYSHFNGVYAENGTHDGRPKYTEQNKEKGEPFQHTVGAEIIYCQETESWVFAHQLIKTSPNEDDENECSWLLVSPQTEEFDLIEISESSKWSVWTGRIEQNQLISITCNECHGPSDCNYHGQCVDQKCQCAESHSGMHCEFDRPCQTLRTEKSESTLLNILQDPTDDRVDFVEIYGRPVYVMRNMTGKPYNLLRMNHPDDDDVYFKIMYNISDEKGVESVTPHRHYHFDLFDDDDFFMFNNETSEFQNLLENYTFVLQYTGRRWYGQMKEPSLSYQSIVEEEFHAFWSQSYADNSTLLVSAPIIDDGTPVGVDFFEMRRRNEFYHENLSVSEYGPFGVLIPLVDYRGAFFFHCTDD